MNVRYVALVVLAAAVFGASAQAQVTAQSAGPAVTPPGIPAPNGNVATAVPAIVGTPEPTASPSGGRRGRRGGPAPSPAASPSETPEPPQFSTMDGVWEVALQPLNGGRPVYSHLYVTQKADELSGTWVRQDPKANPKATFSGSFDGRLFTLTLKDGSHTYTMTGYAENFSDMVGLFRNGAAGDQGTPFTAAHRKKEKLG